MKKMIFAGCLMVGASVFAQAGETDSLKVVNLQRGADSIHTCHSKTPVAFTNVSKEELKKQNFGQDIPFLLSMTPSALTPVMPEQVSVTPHCAYGEQTGHASTSQPTESR